MPQTLNAEEPRSDELSLKEKLARAEFENKLRAFLLVLPLLLFICFSFIAPISLMLWRSVDNPVLGEHLPETMAALALWDATVDETPPESAYAAIAKEMAAGFADKGIFKAASRANFEKSGMRSLITKTAKKVSKLDPAEIADAEWKPTLIEISKKWADRDVWTTLKRTGDPYTSAFYLKAFDHRFDWDESVKPVPKSVQLYALTGWNSVWVRTIWISALVTVLCFALGYPVAYMLASLPMRLSNLLMILVLLPFWTSLLVRTTAWVVVLQTEGVLNDLMINLHLVDERIQLIFNRFGVVVAMTHILLPFMILPLYSVMKTIPASYTRAARSLGARPATAFWRVYFPQSVPGIGAGALLVFILALGYYITPALVGGPKDQLVSYFIADHTNRSLNWGLASALGGVLLAGVLAVYILYDRLVGINNMKLG